VLLHLNYHAVNHSASLKIPLSYQVIYYYLLDNSVSGPSFVPTIIAALHPSNTKWPEPKDKHEIQQFLGFCSFYQQIKEFAKIAKPLTELIDKKEWR